MHTEAEIARYAERVRPQLRAENHLAAYWRPVTEPAEAFGPVLGVVRYEVPLRGGGHVIERRVCVVEPGFLGREPWQFAGHEPFALEPDRPMVVTHWMPLPAPPDDPEVDAHNRAINADLSVGQIHNFLDRVLGCST